METCSLIVLKIGNRVKKYLEGASAEVQILQKDVGSKPHHWEWITDPANEFKTDIFVSIHANANNKQAQGTETYQLAPKSP